MVRNIARLSVASGRVVVQPARCRQVAGCTSSSVDAAAAFTCAHASTSSCSDRAWTVQYSPTRNSFATPRASRSARSAASSAAASTYGSASLPFASSARRDDSSRARWVRSRAAAVGAGNGSMCNARSNRPGQDSSGSSHAGPTSAGYPVTTSVAA